MPQEATSKHLKNATELTLVAEVRGGLVRTLETVSYTTRIGLLLRTLWEIRRRAIESSRLGIAYHGPLEKLQSLHFVRWALLEEGRKLLLAVSFDGPWEPYMRRIVEVAGPLLDLILCSCEGYDDHASDQGHDAFVRWVREHQVEAQFFHAGSPETTADDLRFLKLLESQQRAGRDLEAFDRAAAELRLRDLSTRPDTTPNLLDDAQVELLEGELGALEALFALKDVFPQGDPTRGHVHLLRVAHMILPRFEELILPPLYEKAHAAALAWYRSLEPRSVAAHDAPPLRRDEVQGNILTPYPGMTHGCIALLRIAEPTAAAEGIARIAEAVTNADQAPGVQPEEVAVNVAFTYRGLAALKLEKEEREALPKEFREGMEARAGWLGDVAGNHPNYWRTPDNLGRGPLDLGTVDLVVILQGAFAERGVVQDHDWHDEHPLRGALEELLEGSGLELLAVEVQRREIPADGWVREHFGFRDGISQPKPEGQPNDPDTVALGEILLGHPNDRGDAGQVPELLENGSFLVLRKLRQDVGGFRAILAAHSDDPREQERLAARMMGRLPDGRPIVDDALAGDANDFDYDGEGDTPCPPSAHIRRANPRVPRAPRSLAGTQPPPNPRIMRRGFAYGPRYRDGLEEEERGLFFMAYNASIAEQFEVIQRWISGGNSTGVLSSDADPFLGLPAPGVPERTFRTLVDGGVERVSLGKHPLVSLEWGMYLFTPSIPALKDLAGRIRSLPEHPAGDPEAGRKILRKLDLAERLAYAREAEAREAEERASRPRDPDRPLPKEVARELWKTVLEDTATREQARDLWAAVRAGGGALRTPYGVLLGSDELVMAAFGDHETFSVREYWDRMRRSIGELYLGMDPEPQHTEDPSPEARELDADFHAALAGGRYERESRAPNAWIQGISGRDAFEAARDVTRARLEALRADEFRERLPIDLRRLVGDVLAELSQRWFALPDGEYMLKGGPPLARKDRPEKGHAHCPDDYLATARYIFSPHPTPFVVGEGQELGRDLSEAARLHVDAVFDGGVEADDDGSLFHEMRKTVPADPNDEQRDLIARTLVGSVHGFVGPCYGTLSSVLLQWLRGRRLARFQDAIRWQRENGPEHGAFWTLAGATVGNMQLRPLPYVLHRTVTKAKTLELRKDGGRTGKLKLEPGDRVVLGLLSGTLDRDRFDTEVLFGGTRPDASGPPHHACPGQHMAMGAMLGFLWALLAFGPYRSEGILRVSTPAGG